MTTAFVISHEPNPNRTGSDKATSIIALTFTRALGREGIDVVRVHPNIFDNSLYSRYCKAVEICPDMYESENALTSYLIGLGKTYTGDKVLIPASDDCSKYLALNADRLKESFILLNPTSCTMARVRDKRLQYDLADEVGVPIPETVFPTDLADLEAAAEGLHNYPYIIKPLEAQKWRLERLAHVINGRKAITVGSKEELLSEYARIAEYDVEVMVQEVIAGDDDKLVTFLAYCSKEQKPLAYCIRRKLRQNPVDFGYCTATVSCHNEEVEHFAKQLLVESDYTGVVGIEFKFDSRSGQHKLIEINTRPVNTTGISIGCGVNIPLIAYQDAMGEEPQPVTEWKDGVVWIWLSMDLSAARQLRKQGKTCYREWFQSIRGKRVHAIFARDDLRPFCYYYYGYLRRQISKIPGLSRGPNRIATRVS